ncbi:MAG: SoxR reducing system RseC family protein [Clostridia bacterium]|nr:SoxR reducing system RseC family protein [Clostridia bacterium]
MREIGRVTEIDGKSAIVRVDKKDECSKCGMCLFPKNANYVDFPAENSLKAKVNDLVEIETDKDAKLLGAILVFLIPLILIGLSALLTYLFKISELWTLIFSVIFIILWYTILAVIDKRLKNKSGFCPRIVSILNTDIQGEKENE